MTRKFNSLEEFSKFINKVSKSYDAYQKAALIQMGEELEKDAKGRIGHLQQGGFAMDGWDPLAESTIRDKEKKGYDFNSDHNPLYRTGELRDSIENRVLGHVLEVGSKSEIMLYQDQGTKHIPARSVFALTFYKSKKYIEKTLSDFLLFWIIQQKPIFKKKAD